MHAGIRPFSHFIGSPSRRRQALIPTVLCPHFGKGEPMLPAKTLVQREKELQSLLATPAGRKELGELESRYCEASGRLRPASTSIITYILVHEREAGLIGI